ncbi:DUF4280 domain-containing protein [uncultured Shewanella sp.]|uniref:DUF4280 domain-containing protein n=1 Tax=uncultured Shewanella sp. TaxID=173975 RepID=UPI00261E3BC7|nr:DUF4280 domain-containing protein [uncultured Shewanella sp.]
MGQSTLFEHLDSLTTDSNVDFQNSIDTLKTSVSSWKQVQNLAKGTSYGSTLNQNVGQIIETSAIDSKDSVLSVFSTIENDSASSLQSVDIGALIEKKQIAFNQLKTDFPSQKMLVSQQGYLSQITQVSTALNIDSVLNENSPVNLVETSASQLSLAAKAYADSPSDLKNKVSFESALSDYQEKVQSFSSHFSEYRDYETQLTDQCNSLTSVFAQQTDLSDPQTALSFQAMTQFSETLDSLPQLSSDSSSVMTQNLTQGSDFASVNSAMTDSIKGPCTVSLQNALDHSNITDVFTTDVMTLSIDTLNAISQTATQLSDESMSLSSGVCDEIESALASVSEALSSSLLTTTSSQVNFSFINDTMTSILKAQTDREALASSNSIGLSFSTLTELSAQLNELNYQVIDAVVYQSPNFLSISNLPSLSVPFSQSLTALSSRLQSQFSNENAANFSDVSTQALSQKVQSVLAYSDNFLQIDKENMNTLLAESNLSSLSGLDQQSASEGISALVPDIDTLISMTKETSYAASIESSVNEINALLGEQAASGNVASALPTTMESFLSQANYLSETTSQAISSASATGAIADYQSSFSTGSLLSEQVEQVLLDITLSVTTYAVVTGQASKFTLTGSSQTSSTMATCSGSVFTCSFGMGSGSLVPSSTTVAVNNKAASNINDIITVVNIPSLSGCTNPLSPLMTTTSPFWTCMPVLSAFVATNPLTLISGSPINTINNMATCSFATGGVISFSDASQTTTVSS